jgi:hypothetical protein
MQRYAMPVPMATNRLALRFAAPFLMSARAKGTALPNLASSLQRTLQFPSNGACLMRIRNSMLLAAAAFAMATALPGFSAQAETVVRYGISMADIPLTTGQPDRGAGAYQFTA